MGNTYKVKADRKGKQTVTYECGHCQSPLASPLDEAGETFSCPQCGASIQTPGGEELRKYRLAKEQHRIEAAKRNDAQRALNEIADARQVAEAKAQAAQPGAMAAKKLRARTIGRLFLVAIVIIVIVALLAPTLQTPHSSWKMARDIKAGPAEKELYQAVCNGSLDAVKTAMGNQPDVNAGFEDGETSLMHLCRMGMLFATERESESMESANNRETIEALKMLISRGADVNMRDDRGESALHFACIGLGRPSDSVIQSLISAGADLNAADGTGRTPLFLASGSAIDLLAKSGANINATDDDGITSMHDRARNGDLDAIKRLLANGADFNLKNNKGLTPLKTAELSFRDDVASYLKSAGATE